MLARLLRTQGAQVAASIDGSERPGSQPSHGPTGMGLLGAGAAGLIIGLMHGVPRRAQQA